jgi:transposase
VTAAGSAGSDCIFERLRIEHGYAGGYTVVKDYVRIARARSREVFVPLVHPPGRAQVDFGECIGVIGGVRMKLHVFCFDLPQSDACFSGSCHFLRGAGGG